ncbi:hypothetical protein ALC56_00914, partial [Trachymyrmex septentrionalis]
LRCSCWNIQSCNGRDQEIILELERHKIYICAVSKIKRKEKGNRRYNKETLIAFCAENELQTNNTYFNHKPLYKTTWSNSRDQTFSIDYTISNRTIHSSQIQNLRTLTSANIGFDLGLILCKIRL